MEYLHKEFDLAEGDIVEVTLAGNVLLLAAAGIDAAHIVKAVKSLLG